MTTRKLYQRSALKKFRAPSTSYYKVIEFLVYISDCNLSHQLKEPNLKIEMAFHDELINKARKLVGKGEQ